MPRTSFAEARATSGGRLVRELSATLAILKQTESEQTTRQYSSAHGARQGDKWKLSKRCGTSRVSRGMRSKRSRRKRCDGNGRGQWRKFCANLRALSETEEYEGNQQEKRAGGRVRAARDRGDCIQTSGTTEDCRKAETIRGSCRIRGGADRCGTSPRDSATRQPGVSRTSQSVGVRLPHHFRNCRASGGAHKWALISYGDVHSMSGTNGELSRHDICASGGDEHVFRRHSSQYPALRLSQNIRAERTRRQHRARAWRDCPSRG